MNKSEAIKLLRSEDWTKEDAMRALETVNFKSNPDEITIRRAISHFAGSELINRQRLQAAQKGLVTKKNKEIGQKDNENQSLYYQNKILELKIKQLIEDNNDLIETNEQIIKENKALKNLVDEIRIKLAINTKKLLQYEDSEIRKALVHMFNLTLG
ncbi:hypothetical protein FJR38_02075 [Anabaena sp. UHCC 0253]|uniref:hypothetical protein n=1 Tax=Anabaena sp. UHCC 0253 TaxID=2590019 RepID=UPI0014487F21|nr:hypothetical protein [Anabaena sp. UHCC 0253]MTJ51556.1 hypothetical protein [Anabaena sp. UHCC 0253]